MKLFFRYFSFLRDPISILLFGLFFLFLAFAFSYERIINYFNSPTQEEIIELDSLVIQARNLARLDPQKSLEITLDLLAKSEEKNYKKGLADSYRLLSISSLQSRNFVLTKEYIAKAENIYTELGNELGLADIQISYGSLYIYMEDTISAIKPYRKAYDIFSRVGRNDRLSVAAYNLAFSYSSIPNLDSTKYFLNISESLKKNKEDVPGFGVIHSLKGKIAYLEGDYGLAEKIFKESLDYYYENQAQESYVAFFETVLMLSEILRDQGNVAGAKELLERSITNEAIYLSESLSRKIFIDLIEIYESEGNFENSTKYFWAKESFEAELERRKVAIAKKFSAEMTLYRGLEIENKELISKISTINKFIFLGAIFTFLILILFLRLIYLHRNNKELKILVDKSYQIANIGTFEIQILKNQKVQFLNVSDVITDILAVNPESVYSISMPVESMLDFNEQEKLKSLLSKYLDKDEFFKEEFQLINQKQERKIIRVIAKASSAQSDGVMLKGILLDITSEVQILEQTRENLEKEKKLKELRGQFMHMTSHEFRTPLSNVSSAIELISLLYPRISPEELQIKFKSIVQNARINITKLVGMLDDLLLHERIQSDEFELRIDSFDLREFFESLIFEMSESSNPEVTILLMMPEEGLLIKSDKDLLHHIFTNLLGNSIKYLDKKLPIEFEVTPMDKKIHFRIKDYGIGIPEKDLKKLFTPFKRASNVAGIQGSGLGLSIVKRMVNKLGGKIEVTSKAGEFTQFLVVLPVSHRK